MKLNFATDNCYKYVQAVCKKNVALNVTIFHNDDICKNVFGLHCYFQNIFHAAYHMMVKQQKTQTNGVI